MNRPANDSFKWVVLTGALVIQVCLGVVYAWSVFQKPLIAEFGWTKSEANMTFSISLMAFAGFMIYAGRLQDRKGPRLVASIGGILLGAGFILASFTTELWHLYLSYGVLAGAGVGFAYVCPIAALMKWFPTSKGLISGIAVAGFGGGSLIFAPMAAQITAEQGWRTAFWILGIIFLVLVVIGAQAMKNPDDFEAATAKGDLSNGQFTPAQMMATNQFKLLWFIFMCSAMAGLMVIGHLSPFGQEGGLTAVEAAKAIGVLAIFNAVGRILWGWSSDKLGLTRAMAAMAIIQAGLMFILIKMNGTFLNLAIASAIVGFNYGGIFSLFPAATASFFGTRSLGANYALLFTAYGVAGLLGGQIGARVYDATESYFIAFVIAGILSLVAAGLSLMVHVPKPAEA